MNNEDFKTLANYLKEIDNSVSNLKKEIENSNKDIFQEILKQLKSLNDSIDYILKRNNL